MTSLILSWTRDPIVADLVDALRELGRAALTLVQTWTESARAQVSRCEPSAGEIACACVPPIHVLTREPDGGGPLIIEGWIGFPIAIADGTATGTVFLEATPEAGVRARVVANLAVEQGGYQNWIHFRLPLNEEFGFEEIYSLRATLVATDLRTGQKRLFGTPRAAAIQNQRSEAGVVLELEDWG